MPRAYEIPTSPNGSGVTFELTFGVEGTIDDLEAEGLAAAKAPIAHRHLPRQPIPNMRCVARGIYEFTYTYGFDDSDDSDGEPQGDLPTIGRFSTKPAGGTQHITQCLYQIGYSNLGEGATQEVETARVIGLHKDGVHGCDIRKPGSIITLEKLWLPAAITGDYIAALERLDGKQNIAPYTMRWSMRGTRYQRIYEAGELQFAGCEWSTNLTPAGITAWQSVYTFLYSPNRQNVDFGSADAYTPGGGAPPAIKVPFIGGHSYPWAYYGKKELTGTFKATIEAPKAIFVATVLEAANFVTVLGF